jgi:hypothetical protein
MSDNNELIAEGLRAFASLKRGNKRAFPSWLAVGEGLSAGRRLLMERLQLNDLHISGIGQKAHTLWLRESGYVAVPSEARVALSKIANPEHLLRIKKWYEALSEKQKLRWNHPTTIWQNWQRHIGSKVREKTTLVAMTRDLHGNITSRLAEGIDDIHIDNYVCLVMRIIRFIAKRSCRDEGDIMQLVRDSLIEEIKQKAA